MTPKPEDTRGWVIVYPKGKPIWTAAAETRAEAIRLTANVLLSWKELYRIGYRVKRCRVEE